MPAGLWSKTHSNYARTMSDPFHSLPIDGYPKSPDIFPVLPCATLLSAYTVFAQRGLSAFIASGNDGRCVTAAFGDFCGQLQIKHWLFSSYF